MICRHCGGLDLDHMGAHVAVGVLPGFLVLFSARNELDKYLISTNAPLEEGYDTRYTCEPEIMAEQMKGRDVGVFHTCYWPNT